MVFPGRFSTGCLRCRQRKVKCDETKPSCKRCQIYGKPCTGYTDQFHFRSTLTKSNFERRASGSSDSTFESTSSSNGQHVFAGPKPAKKGTKAAKAKNAAATRRPMMMPTQGIMAALEPSYEQTSLCYFVRRFVSPYGADGFPGHLSFLPTLYNHAEQGLLETATLSVAQMAAYNRFGGEKFLEQSLANYGRTIKMMQETIRSEDDAADDRVLASILLLCTLKDINGEGSGDPNEHAPGLFYLLEKRGLAQIATSRGIELFLLGVIRLQVYSFLHEDDTYSDPGSIASVLGLFNPLIRAMSMMCRVLRLRHRLRRYMSFHLNFGFSREYGQSPGSRDPSEGAKECMDVLKECFAVLDDFDVWDSEVTSYWEKTFEGRTLPPTALGAVSSQTNAAFYDAETACTIILIRSARLILLLSMLQYHGAVQLASNDGFSMGNDAAWADCVAVLEEDVRKIIGDMLACVPYALGDLDPSGSPTSLPYDGAGAIVIVHSIRLVGFCAYATPEQVAQAKEILLRMNVVIGIRSAEPWKGKDREGLGKKWADEQAFMREMSVMSPGRSTGDEGPDDSDGASSQQYNTSPTNMNFECVF